MVIGKRMMMSLFILMMVFVTGVYGAPVEPAPETAIEISVDGTVKALAADQYIYLINDRAYVPLRYVSEALNVDAGWHPGRKVAFVGQTPDWKAVDEEPAANAEPLPIRFYSEAIKTELPAGLSLFIRHDTVYVPLRYMAELLDKEVQWVPRTDKNAIRIQTVD